ncbi:MAG: hypothetical protein HFG62_07250 [Lachnospiraceae bacterium]|jgi:hypothetical protein|nr:hypothetical protein [Lachnospiraceae bacterium]
MKKNLQVKRTAQDAVSVCPNGNEITYHNKDVASKVTGEALMGSSLAPFGLPHIKIVDVLPTSLPAIESNELRLDNLFLLEDAAVAIIDYESGYSQENFVKYLNYAARVVKRYAIQKRLPWLKKLKIIVIYTADVENASAEYDLEGILVRVEPAYLVHMDTEQIRQKLEEKIDRKEPLNTEEQMQMMVLPLTVKGKERKQKVIMEVVELAKRIKNQKQKNQVLAGILTFTDKIIDEDYRERVKEEWEMTQIGKMIFDDGFKAGEAQGEKRGEKRGVKLGEKRGEERGRNRKVVEQSCRKLRKGKAPEVIAEELEEGLELIQSICRTAAGFAPEYDWNKVYRAWSAGTAAAE